MLLLQLYFILYSLRGGVLLGIFPALLACVKCLISKFYDDNPDEMRYEFRKTYTENFKITNLIGWPLAILLGLMLWEMEINRELIQNNLLGFFLGLFVILELIMISHMPITILRFDLSFWDYFSQAMLIALSSPFELVSIILSFVLMEIVFSRVAIIPLLFMAPIVAMPFSWFSYNSVEKIIKKRGGS